MNSISQLIGKYILQIVVSLETIILFLLVIIPTEYLLTEKYLVYKYIDGRIKTLIFLVVFLIFFTTNYFSKKFLRAGKIFLRPLFLICLLTVVGNKYYSNYYGNLQQYPRIYSISSNWSIQGMPVTIEGKNFGPTWQPGKVMVDDINFEIQSWSEQKVVAIQPVPDHFFNGNIKVINNQNNESQSFSFEIKDPAILNKND